MRLNPGELLHLTSASGAAVEVLSGLVWITEEGREEDNFVAAGQRHRLTSKGLVLIGAERHGDNAARAEIALRPWNGEIRRIALCDIPETSLVGR